MSDAAHESNRGEDRLLSRGLVLAGIKRLAHKDFV